MCVIVCSDKGSCPPSNDLDKMRRSNPDGIGIAWLSNGKVSYRRGLKYSKLAGLVDIISSNKFPYILHFRIATIGGKDKRLCHPFPVSSDQKVLFSMFGETNYVVAHNGHWSNWDQEECLPELKSRIIPWSDTAAIAYCAAKINTLWLPPGDRVATLHNKEGLKTFPIGHSRWVERNGYFMSNLGWERKWETNVSQLSVYHGYWHNNTGENQDRINRYPCDHGYFRSCPECYPTNSGLPVEKLPSDDPTAKFSQRDNGIPKGVKQHGCQHLLGTNNHWHCGNCNRPECIKAINDYKESQLATSKLPTSPQCCTSHWCQDSSNNPCTKCESYLNDLVMKVELRRQRNKQRDNHGNC